MTKESKVDIDFRRYQDDVRNTLRDLLRRGWDDDQYDTETPPEYMVGLILHDMVMESELDDEFKKEWLKSQKYFYDRKSLEDLRPCWKSKQSN
tara:strand:+ start:253 stop:531 length:279 start_codon:yes stop_codon:yes gene_type:complete